MTARFTDVIMPAVNQLKAGKGTGLTVQTDDLSTLVHGGVTDVFTALRDSFAAAAEEGEHVAASILFSRGCPGETECCSAGDKLDDAFPALVLPDGNVSDREISAQFSLYPLGTPDYMDCIYDVVDITKRKETFTCSKNFCTRIDGTVADVFQSIYESFITTQISHVVIHVTLSANSPSKKGEIL